MNRGTFAGLAQIAVAIAASAVPASAQTQTKIPSLTIEPVEARSLLALADPDWQPFLTEVEPDRAGNSYRLRPQSEIVTGRRARIAMELGDTMIFADVGSRKRHHRVGPPDPADSGRKAAGSKQYGAGIERTVGPFEVSAAYQYSRVNAERSESNLNLSNPRSHAVRATARVRFGP